MEHSWDLNGLFNSFYSFEIDRAKEEVEKRATFEYRCDSEIFNHAVLLTEWFTEIKDELRHLYFFICNFMDRFLSDCTFFEGHDLIRMSFD